MAKRRKKKAQRRKVDLVLLGEVLAVVRCLLEIVTAILKSKD